jgi:hypothetical protein
MHSGAGSSIRVVTSRRAVKLPSLALALFLSACATAPVTDYTVDVPAGVTDGRTRFTETFCSVLNARGDSLPDNRPCADALSHVAGSPQPTGKPVELGPSRRHLVAAVVPGIGYACIAAWLQPPGTAGEHLAKFGYGLQVVQVDALSGSTRNAGQVRDAIMALPPDPGPPRVVLFAYSKGTPDVLEAVVRYPELQQHVAAVVSIAGAVGGSPLADDAEQAQANLLVHWPKARCDPGDGGAVESLRTGVRKKWLVDNRLPPGIRYYSVVTLPDRDRISSILTPTYRKLAKIDPRNDSQMIYSDQIIPGSTLVGFLNADHWAVAVPIDRAHGAIGSTFVNHNDYPREALLESLMRYVEEDLAAASR